MKIYSSPEELVMKNIIHRRTSMQDTIHRRTSNEKYSSPEELVMKNTIYSKN